jgi:hypothetical protein
MYFDLVLSQIELLQYQISDTRLGFPMSCWCPSPMTPQGRMISLMNEPRINLNAKLAVPEPLTIRSSPLMNIGFRVLSVAFRWPGLYPSPLLLLLLLLLLGQRWKDCVGIKGMSWPI